MIQHAVASQVSPANGVIDERLQTGEFYPVDFPIDGVHFSGAVTSREVLASPLRNQATKLKWMLLGVSIFITSMPLLLVVVLRDKIRMEITLLLFAFLLFLNLRLWRVYRRHLDWTKTPDQILLRSKGVLGHHTLHASTPAGASIYRWDIFTEATIQNDVISLALPGTLGHRVLIVRSQFADDSDWSRAKEIIREQSRFFPVLG